MRNAFRLRNPKNRGAYITIEDAYRENPNITGYQLYDRKGRRLGDATPEQVKQAAEASARGDVKEVVLAENIPFGEVAKIVIDGTEYLVG
jgi:hypothetical protein